VKLGILLPRYGIDVVGGTEHWLQMLAEHLVDSLGWAVEAFTTCATSAVTWADELPPGSSRLNGVTVHRFRSVSGRDPRYGELDPVIRRDPDTVTDELAHRFVSLVGPVCPDAIAAAESSANDLVAVTPYLFWPAVHGIPRLGRRVVFHGASHDEAELHLRIMRPVFEAVGGFAFNSFAERALVERTFPIGHLPASVIGNAVVERPGEETEARLALGLGRQEPFVLCVGRVERGKGAHTLAEMWRLYRRRHPTAPRMVMLGPVNEALPTHENDDVVVVGRQSEAVKWGALRACQLLVAPSAFESFSLVVVEAWLAGRAVAVNGRCEATVEACRRGGGGLWYRSYGEFEVLMDRLLRDAELRDRLAASGERYARELFDWNAIVDRYAELIDRVLTAGR
jgi:glycosyltransferase involved in cell wall biosynthesis